VLVEGGSRRLGPWHGWSHAGRARTGVGS